MKFTWNMYVLLSFTWILTQVWCQLSDNTPPILTLERSWQISDTEDVGSKIIQAHGMDSEDDSLIYGLEAIHYGGEEKNLPFTINATTGIVYLNESLKGRAGEDIHLYVTAFDGELTAKTEVFANILNSSAPYKPQRNHPSFQLGANLPSLQFPNIPGFNPRMPTIYNNLPTSILNNPPPMPKRVHFQQKTYPENMDTTFFSRNDTNSKTYLRPVVSMKKDKDNIASSTQSTSTKRISDLDKVEIDNEIKPVEQTVKSAPDITTTLVPILSVCAVFLVVGVIAVMFRKKIQLGKSKGSKDDMRKESSSNIALPEDPGLAMQQWRGPRAFSNRYEPWERDANQPQAGNQLSSSVNSPDLWEFPRHRLKFFNILGEGAFGQVWKCEASDLHEKDEVTVVAVKTLKENANEKERSDLISELQVMKMLEPHINVVRLLGCCTDKEPIFLIMEYVTKGKLQSYLRSSRAERYYNNMHGQSKSLTSRDLTSFVYQVGKGMEFLSANGIIHRDLAARNVLITEEHTCKVADFGFARDVITSHIYERKSEGRLPIRWMAPESLYDNIFSVKSDVWSFGILIWEIVTLGSTPYPGLSAAEVMKKVRDGHRLDKPDHCRRELYNIMYYCWDKDPKQRPSFTECVELLEKLLMSETDYIELERFPDHSYYNMISLSGEKL